jgi:hypothetical protein
MPAPQRRREDRQLLNQIAGTPATVPTATALRLSAHPAMTAIPGSCWLFTRGSQSVRLVREEGPHGCRLFLDRPGTESVTLDFADVTECMKRQAEIEQGQLAEGFQLAQSLPERRARVG